MAILPLFLRKIGGSWCLKAYFFVKSFVISNNICTFATTYSPRFPLEQRAQGESFLFFLPYSVFSYSINAEEDRSDIDKFVLNHITSDKQ